MNRSASPQNRTSIDYLIRKGSIITIITLVSRPLGYIREAIQAYLFGATLLVDAFVIAFNFPEMIQTLFFSGATSAFLVPVCSRYLKEKEEFSRIYATFINLSIIVTVAVSLVFFLLSSDIMKLIAPGFQADGRETARILFLIMIPVIGLHAVLSVMKAFLNAREHFAAPELSGILWNILFILFALALSGKIGIYSLAVGVSVGSLAQVLFQIPYLRNHGIRYSLSLSIHHPAMGEAKRLFTGALIATSIVPINSFVGRIIASYLPSGEVASLSYAFRIFILPFSLFAVPVYTVLFSKISGLYHDKDWKGIREHIDSSLVLLCVTLIPATIFLCCMGDTFVKLLYQRGAFSAHDTFITYKALFGYSVGLIFYALSISFVRIFNAFHDVKTPALIGITSIILNVLLAYLLMMPLKNLGISLATSIVSFYNFALLFLVFKKRSGYRMGRTTRRDIIKSLLAGILAALLMIGIRKVSGAHSYPAFAAGFAAAAGVYGVLFKNYYLGYLRRRRGGQNQGRE
ncbi:MAG: putative peptidoglycan biosynthesis protein MurJ [Syntrophorhabdaceae bacterium PtaU1.Bin034]|jgi:putative peptidoglycan lipid II flippase|nr:MAG: putative peptidoglycan biosynthesis protein MurJ [Syntrophorhabdaceae bacterium PtaU1.Bin034]